MIQNILKLKIVKIAILLFLLELIVSSHMKAYYIHFYELKNFFPIETEETIFYYSKTMKHLLGNTDPHNILIINLLEPSHFLIQIIKCTPEITKITIIPKNISFLELLGANLKGCYVIETYFFNNEQIQKNVENLYYNTFHSNKYIANFYNNKLTEQYDIVMRMNYQHYTWMNFMKIINYDFHNKIDRLDPNDEILMDFIRKRTIGSYQSISLFILRRSINFYYTILPFFLSK